MALHRGLGALAREWSRSSGGRSIRDAGEVFIAAMSSGSASASSGDREVTVKRDCGRGSSLDPQGSGSGPAPTPRDTARAMSQENVDMVRRGRSVESGGPGTRTATFRPDAEIDCRVPSRRSRVDADPTASKPSGTVLVDVCGCPTGSTGLRRAPRSCTRNTVPAGPPGDRGGREGHSSMHSRDRVDHLVSGGPGEPMPSTPPGCRSRRCRRRTWRSCGRFMALWPVVTGMRSSATRTQTSPSRRGSRAPIGVEMRPSWFIEDQIDTLEGWTARTGMSSSTARIRWWSRSSFVPSPKGSSAAIEVKTGSTCGPSKHGSILLLSTFPKPGEALEAAGLSE